jgi:hypothetical protein
VKTQILLVCSLTLFLLSCTAGCARPRDDAATQDPALTAYKEFLRGERTTADGEWCICTVRSAYYGFVSNGYKKRHYAYNRHISVDKTSAS